jgi:hypothetical protein
MRMMRTSERIPYTNMMVLQPEGGLYENQLILRTDMFIDDAKYQHVSHVKCSLSYMILKVWEEIYLCGR